MVNRLIIGTANFGLQYGIASNRKLNIHEAHAILSKAHKCGVMGIDTAKDYGDAERVVGDFFLKEGKVFYVITKIPNRAYLSSRDVEDEVFGSLRNLNIDFVDAVLIHSATVFEKYGKAILPVFRSLLKDGIIGCYGISVYHEEEAKRFLSSCKGDKVAVEFPLNLFDRRFISCDITRTVKDSGGKLFARSVFLQGLMFLNTESLRGPFVNIKDKINKLRELSKDFDIRPECIALQFVVSKEWLDGVIIGIDGVLQLERDIECLSARHQEIYFKLEDMLDEIKEDDEDIILPYKWKV